MHKCLSGAGTRPLRATRARVQAGAGLVSGPKETAGKSQRPRGSQCSGRCRLRGQGVRPGVRPNTVCTRRVWEVVGSIDPSGCCGCCGFRGCCEHIVRVQGRFVRARRIQRSTRGLGWPPAPAARASMAATINHRQGTTDRPSLPRTDKGMVGERLIATGIPLIWILVTCVRQQAEGNVRWPAPASVGPSRTTLRCPIQYWQKPLLDSGPINRATTQ